MLLVNLTTVSSVSVFQLGNLIHILGSTSKFDRFSLLYIYHWLGYCFYKAK